MRPRPRPRRPQARGRPAPSRRPRTGPGPPRRSPDSDPSGAETATAPASQRQLGLPAVEHARAPGTSCRRRCGAGPGRAGSGSPRRSLGPEPLANAVTQGSRWWVAHWRARRATSALLRTSALPAAENTRPSSSLTRRARSASRSRRSITASSWRLGADRPGGDHVAGPGGRRGPGPAAPAPRAAVEGVGQQQRDEDDLVDAALDQLVDHLQGVRLVSGRRRRPGRRARVGSRSSSSRISLADLGDARDRCCRSPSRIREGAVMVVPFSVRAGIGGVARGACSVVGPAMPAPSVQPSASSTRMKAPVAAMFAVGVDGQRRRPGPAGRARCRSG